MLLEILDFQGLDKTRPRLGLATVNLVRMKTGRAGRVRTSEGVCLV